ncbi:hypothetical protein ACFO5Q_02755 [Kordiimonas lipolytica]|uniref:Lipoprotein n=1 Tax=Kordiimonas lipolytica TaxID=1662421 RepID=A0ABV8U6D6_9PROT|nr:hypothetical protein [Kordiimonas lipolytica]
MRWLIPVLAMLLSSCAAKPALLWQEAIDGRVGEEADGLARYFSDDGYGSTAEFLFPGGRGVSQSSFPMPSKVWKAKDASLWQEIAAIVREFGGQNIEKTETCGPELRMSHDYSNSLYIKVGEGRGFISSGASGECHFGESDEAGRRVQALLREKKW